VPRTEVETVIHSDSAFATVAFLRIKDARLEPKPPQHDFQLRIPPLLEERYEELRSSMLLPDIPDVPGWIRTTTHQSIEDPFEIPTTATRAGSWVSVSNVHRTLDDREEVSLEDEVKECFRILQGWYIIPMMNDI
jgi:diphthine-ammonia ligase